jgi:hypothetical protein
VTTIPDPAAPPWSTAVPAPPPEEVQPPAPPAPDDDSPRYGAHWHRHRR